MSQQFSNWRKSSRSSNGNGGNCVEFASDDRAVGVRDSKEKDGPVIGFGSSAWRSFLAGAKRGVFDTPDG